MKCFRKGIGWGNFLIEDDGIAKFQNAKTQEKSEGEREKFVGSKDFSGLHWPQFAGTPSKMQFQQTDFEGQGFLDIGVEDALRFFQNLKIFERLMG